MQFYSPTTKRLPPGRKSLFCHPLKIGLMIDGIRRLVDYYQPRKQIEVAFTDGKIILRDDEQISAFADKFIVEKRLGIKNCKACSAAD